MELLDKECATAESRANELRVSLTNLMAQEEQLRLQQASLREHLATGCKVDLGMNPEAQGPSQGTINS